MHKDEDAAKKDNPQTLEEFLTQAKERWRLASEAETGIRKDALADMEFRAGQQWPADVKAQREIDKRPCLTINRLPSFIKQVTNEQRQNRPGIRVDPTDDLSDPETAEIIQGLIRHIEVKSNADIAYDTAFEHAATMGFGWIRILTDYIDSKSFDQEIKFARVPNPFSVYSDPHASQPDRSDMNWAFVIEDIAHDTYRFMYPKSELAGMQSFEGIGDRHGDWLNRETIRVAEYFYIERKMKTLVILRDGNILFKDEIPTGQELEELKATMTMDELAGFEIQQERKSEVREVKYCKINAIEKIEEKEWPGQYIPLIPVLGDELNIDGRRELVGMVRYAKDPQRMVNYWASAETETISLAPKAPWLIAEGQIEDYEADWRDANKRNLAVLTYKPMSHSGRPVPPPARNVVEPPIQAIAMARQQSGDDLKSVIGIYDDGLGKRSRSDSGKAIQLRQRESDTATFHFVDNLRRSVRHGGVVVWDLIPHIYDIPRIARIIGVDENQKMARVINDPTQPAMQEERDPETGKLEKIFNIGVGRYDINIAVGKSFATKRQEAVESMIELTKSFPQLMEIAGHVMVKNMDWPGADKVAELLKRNLPAHLQGDDDDEEIPPQVQAQMAQMEEQTQAITQELEEAKAELESEQAKLASDEKIAMAKLEVEKLKVELDSQIDQGKLELEKMRLEFDKMKLAETLSSEEEIARLKTNGRDPSAPSTPASG